jgi:hypothetical protein
MNVLKGLFAANEFVKRHQGCVGRNGLPFAHHTLRVDNFASEHGATVHGKLQDVNHFFAAIHFHVRACRHKESPSLRFLRRSVIEQTPERSNGAIALDGAVIDINSARIGGGYFFPFGLSRKWRAKNKQTGNKRQANIQNSTQSLWGVRIFNKMVFGIHAPYYKVAH